MAFVYRAQNNLSIPTLPQITNQLEYEHHQGVKKSLSLAKGLPCLKNKKAQEIDKKNSEQGLNILPNQQNMKRQREQKKKNNSDYFFKSQCKREAFKTRDVNTNNSIGSNDEGIKYKKQSAAVKKKQKENGNIMNLIEARRKINQIQKAPSIPGKYQKYGYVTQENQDRFRYPQKVSRPKYEGTNESSPGPGQYHSQIKSKPKGVIKYTQKQQSKSKHQSKNEQLFALASEDSTNSTNQKLRNILKPLKKQKKCYYLKTREESSDYEGETSEYQDDSTPGPGSYDYQIENKKNFRSKKNQFQKIFISQSHRFQVSKQSISEGFTYFQTKPKKKKYTSFFISKLKRDLRLNKKDTEHSPNFYDIRQSIENDSICNVLKNSPKLFDNNIPRIPNLYSSFTPGPGHYNPQLPKYKIEPTIPELPVDIQQRIQSKITPKQNELISKKDKDKSRIHERKNQPFHNPNYVPFGSKSPRSKQIDRSQIPHAYLQEKTKVVANKAPFNQSALKNVHERNDYIAQVGLYEVGDSDKDWNTKTFNVIFN